VPIAVVILVAKFAGISFRIIVGVGGGEVRVVVSISNMLGNFGGHSRAGGGALVGLNYSSCVGSRSRVRLRRTGSNRREGWASAFMRPEDS